MEKKKLVSFLSLSLTLPSSSPYVSRSLEILLIKTNIVSHIISDDKLLIRLHWLCANKYFYTDKSFYYNIIKTLRGAFNALYRANLTERLRNFAVAGWTQVRLARFEPLERSWFPRTVQFELTSRQTLVRPLLKINFHPTFDDIQVK